MPGRFWPIWSAAALLPLLKVNPVDHSKSGAGGLHRKAGAELPPSKLTDACRYWPV